MLFSVLEKNVDDGHIPKKKCTCQILHVQASARACFRYWISYYIFALRVVHFQKKRKEKGMWINGGVLCDLIIS